MCNDMLSAVFGKRTLCQLTRLVTRIQDAAGRVFQTSATAGILKSLECELALIFKKLARRLAGQGSGVAGRKEGRRV